MAKSFGWNGSAVGLVLEGTYGSGWDGSAYGSDPGSPDIWLPIVSSTVKPIDPLVAQASIIAPTAAAAQGARSVNTRLQQIPTIGGSFIVEGFYQGLDRLFYNYFGAPTQAAAGTGGFSHVFPGTGGLVDLDSTLPGIKAVFDVDDETFECYGGFIEAITYRVLPNASPQLEFEFYAQTYQMGSAVAPSVLSPNFIQNHQQCLDLSINGGAYADFSMDGFEISMAKNMERKPAYDCVTRGIRQPIRENGYWTPTGSAVHLKESGQDIIGEYVAGDTIGLRLRAQGADAFVSSSYYFEMEMKECVIQELSSTETQREGARIETINFEVDTNDTDAALVLTTRNGEDATGY